MGSRKKHLVNSELEKGDVKCVWCQKVMKRTEITIEHMQPKALGGSNEDDNLKLACRKCNNDRGNVMGLIYFGADQLRDHIRQTPVKRGRYVRKYARLIDEQTDAFRLWEERHKAAGLNFVHDPWHHLKQLDPRLLEDVLEALNQRRRPPTRPQPVKTVAFRTTWSLKKFWFRFKRKWNVWKKRWSGRWAWLSYWILKTRKFVFQRSHRYCYWCNTRIGLLSGEVDYRLPPTHGGRKGKENCVFSCHCCKKERAKAIDLVTLRPKIAAGHIRSRPNRCLHYRNGFVKTIEKESDLLQRWDQRHQTKGVPISLDPLPQIQMIEALVKTTRGKKQEQQSSSGAHCAIIGAKGN